MHPRIKTRYLDNLQAKKTQAVSHTDEIVATQVADMEKLVSKLNAVNGAGTITIPNDIAKYYWDRVSIIRKLDLDTRKNPQKAQDLLLELNLVGKLLNSHLVLQAVKHNLELLRSALADA